MRRLILTCLLAGIACISHAEPLRVVSSIKPLQLLVSAIGGPAVDSRLLLPPDFSPHDARLKPSQWQMLENAELLVWVGPELERFLASAMERRSNVLGLQAAIGETDADDPHIWMSLAHVAAMAHQLRDRLGQLRPDEAARFSSNTRQFVARLQALGANFAEGLKQDLPHSLLPHNGYSHFERQYGLVAGALLSESDEHLPGTAHLAALRSRLLKGEFDCVFREPQQSARLFDRLLSDVDVQVVPLDPMGVTLLEADTANGAGFERYYRKLGEAFLACQQAGRVRLADPG